MGVVRKLARTKAKAAKHTIRVVIPDSHGNHIDVSARDAVVSDIRQLRPDRIIGLGDHLDCGGTFNTHQRTYTNEMCESYEDDCAAANEFLDLIQKAAPDAEFDYIEGNHEQHVERWAARAFHSHKDAEGLLERYGPQKVLRLKERGARYYKRSTTYMGLSIPGTIKLGKCFFVHGVSHSQHAAAQHLARFGANVVFGHVHRVQMVQERNVTSDGHGAWCPGTLAKLQPLYRHTAPTNWGHGYGVQFVNESTGTFLHFNVPIVRGKSLLMETVNAIKARAA